VHKSQLANYYVSNPIDVVKVGEKVKIRVLEIDEEREKVSLSMKDPTQTKPERPKRKEADEPYGRRAFDEEGSSIRSNITFS
jgi:ribosomal protein S1